MMTPERLAEIRERTRIQVEILGMVGRTGDDVPRDWQYRAELVAEVDRLRAGIEALIEDCENHEIRQMGGPQVQTRSGEWVFVQDVLTDLLNPTEGGAP